ncbi:MAG: acyl-CoA dehydratase activase [Candidatus Aminicenantes bacterium]|nr:acyl-CoA dehydratase activase [Candidatus Aminicenantes bacterium]
MSSPKPALGIDLGSRTTKIVRLRGGRIESAELFDTVHNPIQRLKENIQPGDFAGIVATGYGRHLVKAHFFAHVVSEIKACALGARFTDPDCRVVIDIGGQDFKIIEVAGDGHFGKFELNDRCAAGTGRFLEVMATILGYRIEEFWKEALTADSPISISSTCTVFAESEVISLIASGKDRRRIALGLHESVIDRIYPLLTKFDLGGPVMLAGGVAKNGCVVERLKKRLKRDVIVPENAQLIPAIGAALIAEKEGKKGGASL